ncbi:hypothetical protein ES703_119080 [subsurface metagenome]
MIMNVLGAEPKLRIKNERYEIYDLPLEDFTLSVTRLEQGKSTLGHSHAWEEAYYIIKGYGRIQIQDKKQDVRTSDFVIIPTNSFHRVFNKSSAELIFLCTFRQR